jgi:hypothetical protein
MFCVTCALADERLLYLALSNEAGVYDQSRM